ncbi:MAG: ribosome small subunit-dependent GTPase A [Planctomycetota bacterium]
MAKHRKIRVSFQKNRQSKPRERDLTRQYHQDESAAELADRDERVRAKGNASRKRTVQIDAESDSLAIDESGCLRGRILMAQGLYSAVVTDDGKIHRCYIRRLLKSLQTEERGVIATGDWVWFKPAPNDEGLIVRVEPRERTLTRGYRKREQVIAANIDQVLIVASVLEPDLKPNLVDRYLVSAERSEIRAIVCVNKVDLASSWRLQPLVGLYSQLGYPILMTSAATGQGIARLKEELRGRETVIVGQSGVGKSSLLNALEPKLHLRVGDVSNATRKGKHTTTTAQLLRLEGEGTVVDTPGVRQFELWDLEPTEVAGYFVEFRAFLRHCRFPGCTHSHEVGCAVKEGVDAGLISAGRHESYLRILRGEPPEATSLAADH